jgi:hypothetical protein
MLKRITCYGDIKHLREIIFQGHGIHEKYKIIEVNESRIIVLRISEYSRLRVLPFENVMEGEWYFEIDPHFQD